MIKKSLAMRGVQDTVFYALGWPLLVYSQRRSLLARNAIQSKFDATYGTDTGGVIPLSQFKIDNPNWVHGVRYAPTSPETFENSLALLNLDRQQLKDFTFVDIGAGKGATLLYAADLGFKAVVGVELVEQLHQVALQNLSRYPSARNIGSSVCIDALRFEMPTPPLVVFFNYPFSSKELMDGVVRNISACGDGRKFVIALNFPYDPATLPSGKLRLVSSVPSTVEKENHNYGFEVL
jgi:hypothetical protein